MNVLIVYAHHEQTSFNKAMKDAAVEVLLGKGNAVIVSDLYAMNFKACADRLDFTELSEPSHFNYLMEQKNAAANDKFLPDIREEQKKLLWADLVLFQFPVWWFSAPAILKGWFDRVMAAGLAWDFEKTYDQAPLKGKKAMLCVTTGGPASSYTSAGINGDISRLLYGINHGTLYFCGMSVLEPFIAYSVFQIGDEARKGYLKEYRQYLSKIENLKPISYPSHSDYDKNGQLKKETVPA